jgi:uncharacterized protein involved in response to NO
MTALKRLFGEGFRIFFLSAGLYALFLMIVWEGWLGIHAAGGMAALPAGAPPHLWHAHEMIFGYAGAALGGFFLTAVPNWTGARAARHLFIVAAAGLWLSGRLAVWFSGALPPVLVAALDLAFLPLLAAKIATQLVRRPKPQNVMFLGLLTIVWSGNLMAHLEWMGLADTLWAGLRTGLLGSCAMIAVLGGRVTPAFTRNAMVQSGREASLPASRKPVEIAGIGAAILLPLAYIAGLPEAATGGLALAAGVATLARLAGWRGLWTLPRPILWALHLGFLMLGAGYLSLGAAAFGWGSEVAALHVLGIGAVGGMTVAVMSRAVLGHTGRPLVAPLPVAAAYGLVAAAAVVRWAGSAVPFDWYYPAVLASGALWLLAFTLFTAALWPAFWGPRADRPEAA